MFSPWATKSHCSRPKVRNDIMAEWRGSREVEIKGKGAIGKMNPFRANCQ